MRPQPPQALRNSSPSPWLRGAGAIREYEERGCRTAAIRIARERALAVAGRSLQHLVGFLDERHLVVAYDGAMANYPAARWLRSVAPGAPIAARSDSWPAVISAVKSGAGLAPMPVAVGDRVDELVRMIGDIPELATKYYLLTHSDQHRTPRVRAFFDFVDAEIRAFRTMLSGHAER